jgi:hypothetical protein
MALAFPAPLPTAVALDGNGEGVAGAGVSDGADVGAVVGTGAGRLSDAGTLPGRRGGGGGTVRRGTAFGANGTASRTTGFDGSLFAVSPSASATFGWSGGAPASVKSRSSAESPVGRRLAVSRLQPVITAKTVATRTARAAPLKDDTTGNPTDCGMSGRYSK